MSALTSRDQCKFTKSKSLEGGVFLLFQKDSHIREQVILKLCGRHPWQLSEFPGGISTKSPWMVEIF